MLIIDHIRGMRSHVHNNSSFLELEELSVADLVGNPWYRCPRVFLDMILCDCFLDDPTFAITEQT